MPEGAKLIVGLRNLRNRPKRPLGDRGPADRVGRGQDVLLDFGGQAEQRHHLGHPSPGDALTAGDLGLIVNLAGLEEGLPLKGLAEKLDDTGRSGCLGWLPVPVLGRKRTDDAFGGLSRSTISLDTDLRYKEMR